MTGTAAVTGAARGIGREVCRQLANRGMTVILTARDGRAGARAAAESTVFGTWRMTSSPPLVTRP